MSVASIAIAGVVLTPLIIGLIQFLKRFAPDAPPNIWLALSMVLAVLGQIVVSVSRDGFPESLDGIAGLVVVSLAFGLATSKAYDETLGANA